jgi:hypothetical protein
LLSSPPMPVDDARTPVKWYPSNPVRQPTIVVVS